MEVKRAGEIMIPLEKFPHIPYWFTLRQAMAELDQAEADQNREKNIPWVILVFNAQNRLLGMVRRRDILKGLGPDILSQKPNNYSEKLFDVTADPNLYKMSFVCDNAINKLQEKIERPVIDFMSPIEVTVEYEEYILQVIYQMIEKDLSFVPVIRNQSVVGVINAATVLQEITKLVI